MIADVCCSATHVTHSHDDKRLWCCMFANMLDTANAQQNSMLRMLQKVEST